MLARFDGRILIYHPIAFSFSNSRPGSRSHQWRRVKRKTLSIKTRLGSRGSSVTPTPISSPGRSRGALRILHLGKHTGTNPDIDERTHWLDVALAEQVVHQSDIDKVHEASVELAFALEIIESHPVTPVEVGVAAKHLLVHVLDLGLKALGEAGGFAEPMVGVGGLGVGGGDEGWG